MHARFSSSLEKIYVDIGLGFHLEMTHTEALDFIKQRTDLLSERAEIFRQKSFEIKARIKVCLEVSRDFFKLYLYLGPAGDTSLGGK